jgi:hypothetical protein
LKCWVGLKLNSFMKSLFLFLFLLPFVSFSQWNLYEEVTNGNDVYRVAEIKLGKSELMLQEYYEDVLFCLHDSTLVSDTQSIVLEITYGLTTKMFILNDLVVNDYSIIISPDLESEKYFNYLKISRLVKIILPKSSPTKCYEFNTTGMTSAYDYIIDI